MTKHPKENDRLRKIVEAFPKITITVLGVHSNLCTRCADEFAECGLDSTRGPS